jgi:hypothetical protein
VFPIDSEAKEVHIELPRFDFIEATENWRCFSKRHGFSPPFCSRSLDGSFAVTNAFALALRSVV